MLETALTKRLVEELRRQGAWTYKTHGGPFTRAGVPDLLVCYKGRFLALEVKTGSGVVSPRQMVEIEAVEQAGGFAYVCRGRDSIVTIATRLDEMIDDERGREFEGVL